MMVTVQARFVSRASLHAGHLAVWTQSRSVTANKTVWMGQTKNAVVRISHLSGCIKDNCCMALITAARFSVCDRLIGSFSSGTSRPAVTPRFPSPCAAKQFSCASGECVHPDHRCDLQRDCADGSDEKDCGRTWRVASVEKKNPRHRRRCCLSGAACFPAVDCIMSSWTAWSSCSVSCGLGSLFRQRDILREALPGGSCGGAQFDSRACFPRACPGPLMNLSGTSAV